MANNHANQKRYEEALEVYRILESEILPNTSNHFIAGIYRNIAWALVNQKTPDTENAYRYIILAGEYVKEVEQHAVKLQYMVDKAFVLEKMERHQEALDNLDQAQALLALKDSNIYDTSELNILFLRAKLQYVLGDYSQALETQSVFYTKSIAYKKIRETNEVDELILQYESETAQRQNNILEKKQRLQDLQLQQMTSNADSREILVIILAVCTLLLAWFLLRVITGQKNLVRVTRIDSLTGVVNRRRLLELGDDLFKQSIKAQQSFSVYMIDIDFFKQINDKFGHSVGDKALQEVAILGQNLMRDSDVFGRFGGEEFIALLPNTDHKKAFEVAQRLRQHIEETNWQTLQLSQLTISVGVATLKGDNYDDFSILLKAADEELLKAKQSGRNKVSSDG